MCTWNDETPAIVPAGARISAGKFGQGREVVAEHGGQLGEAVADELHAVARVAGEADHDPVERFRSDGPRSPLRSPLTTNLWCCLKL